MEEKLKHIFYEMIIFAMIYYLGIKMFKDQYLFAWLIFNVRFSLIMISIPLLLVLLNKKVVSVFMTTGITLGIFIGNFLGNYFREISIAKIDTTMNAQEIAQLHLHKGFYIMMAVIFTSIILGIIFQTRENKLNINNS